MGWVIRARKNGDLGMLWGSERVDWVAARRRHGGRWQRGPWWLICRAVLLRFAAPSPPLSAAWGGRGKRGRQLVDVFFVVVPCRFILAPWNGPAVVAAASFVRAKRRSQSDVGFLELRVGWPFNAKPLEHLSCR